MKLLSRIKTKILSPYLYSIVLKSPLGTLTIQQVISFDLEEAIVLAIKGIPKDNPFNEGNWQLLMHSRKKVSEIVSEASESRFTDDEEMTTEKNELMSDIVETGDRKLLEENRAIFSKNEIKYMEDRLKEIT